MEESLHEQSLFVFGREGGCNANKPIACGQGPLQSNPRSIREPVGVTGEAGARARDAEFG